MSLVGEQVAIVSCGISCQTEHQLVHHRDLIRDLVFDPTLIVESLPFDWLVVPVESATRMLHAHRFWPDVQDEMEVRDRPYWRTFDAFYWHHFRGKKIVFDLKEIFDDTVHKFSYLGRKLASIANRRRIIIFCSNTQNNISDMAISSKTPIYAKVTGSQLLRLKEAWQIYFGGGIEMIFVTHADLFEYDVATPEVQVVEIARTPSTWHGDYKEWKTALLATLGRSSTPRAAASAISSA